MSVVYIGTYGSVMALDKNTGKAIWKTELKGGDFVTLLLDGKQLFAATSGELFCLDSATGEGLWHNNLPGMGYGLISIATANGASSAGSVEQMRKRQQDSTTIATTSAINS